jgi:hypothetical protein
MKRSKNSRPRHDSTVALVFDQLECRMVLNADIGFVVLTENTQYDDQGRVWQQELTIDFDNDQVADLRTIDQYLYNADGLTTNYVHQEDTGADGSIDSQYWNEQEYAGDGKLLVSLEGWDIDGDGLRNSQIRSTWTYNEDNNPIHLSTETDVDGDGSFDESTEQPIDPGNGGSAWTVIVDDTQFDEQGRVIFQDVTVDTDGDGAGDYRTIDQYQYNSNGLTTNHLHQEDNGADGVIDSQYWNAREFAEDGRLLTSLDAWDNDGDGLRDSQVRSTWTYDENANLTHILTESDVDGDGIYDESNEENFDPNGGGTTGGDYYVETQDTYDESGRLIRSTYTHFDNGDEIPDSVEVVSWTYLESGLVDVTRYEVDNNADGVVDYLSIGTHEYDVDSALTTTHYQIDENADGVIDSSFSIDNLWLASAANGGEVRDLSTGGSVDPTDDESTAMTTPDVAAVSIVVSSDRAASQQSMKDASETMGAKLEGPGAGDSLQLAGSIVFDSERMDYAVLDDAFSVMGREGSDLFTEDATWMLFESIDGDIDLEWSKNV